MAKRGNRGKRGQRGDRKNVSKPRDPQTGRYIAAKKSSKLLNRKSTALKSYRAGLASEADPKGRPKQARKLNQATQTSLAGKAPLAPGRKRSIRERYARKNPTLKEFRSKNAVQDPVRNWFCQPKPSSRKAGKQSAVARAKGLTSISSHVKRAAFHIWCK